MTAHSTPSSDETAAPIAWQYEWRLRLYSIENYGQDYGWKSTLSNNEPKNLLAEVRNVVPLYASQATTLELAQKRIEELEEAVRECVETFELVERPSFLDPDYSDEVSALGDRIGYGALMSSASASWRNALVEQDCPVGGEFVAGPCHVTVLRALKIARAALTAGAR